MSGLVMTLVAIVVCAVLAGVLVAAIQRRNRRDMDALMDRLTELEARREAMGLASPEPDDAGPEPASQPAPVESVPPTADVLAGKTSYVRRMVEGEANEAASLADQTVVVIHRRIRENITPNQLAEELFVSLRTLERGLSATLGCTPSQLILAMKMREARRLLLSGAYRINEVAYHLGFSSPSHFSKRFKSFYKKAPSELVRRAA